MKFKEIQSVANNCKEFGEGVTGQCKWSVMTHRLREGETNTVSRGE